MNLCSSCVAMFLLPFSTVSLGQNWCDRITWWLSGEIVRPSVFIKRHTANGILYRGMSLAEAEYLIDLDSVTSDPSRPRASVGEIYTTKYQREAFSPEYVEPKKCGARTLLLLAPALLSFVTVRCCARPA